MAINFMYMYNYHNSGYYPSSRLLFKTRRFGDFRIQV
jgi:hypothetical protein